MIAYRRFSRVVPKQDIIQWKAAVCYIGFKMSNAGPRTPKICEYCEKPFMALDRELRRGKARFCSLICANIARNEPRKNPSWRTEYLAKKKADPFYRKQRHANAVIENEIQQDRLMRKPCEICGSLKTEAHHDDYDKPLEVRWLCRIHHMRYHRRRKRPARPFAPVNAGGTFPARILPPVRQACAVSS